jgi:ADP-ribose pyrophosphatase YjhB (NUDIX family)
VKTIIRINPHAVDSPERIAAEKLPPLAVRMLAEAYSGRRDELGDDALLVLDQGKDGKPVYLTIGSRPPELAVGGRRVHGVFAPPDSQEPIATFFDREDAKKWALSKWPIDPAAPPGEVMSKDFKIGEIDATDKPVVRVAVTALMIHEGKVLMGKLKKSGMYVLPEGPLEVGESVESAVQRAVKVSTGLDVGRIAVSKFAPYISTYVEKAGQHFITLVLSCEYVGGDPVALDAMWESVGWFDAENPPEPLIVMVKQIIALAKFNAAPSTPPAATAPVTLPENPPSLVEAAARARAKARVKKARRQKAKSKRTSKRRRRAA